MTFCHTFFEAVNKYYSFASPSTKNRLISKKMAKTKSFILSDESVNTYGFRVLTAGADLEQFRRNPVMYLNHDEYGTPIGRWENIRVEGDKILADPVFDMDDERGREVAGKVERGFLKMASVGLRVIERSEDPLTFLPGQTMATATKWRLREASIVGIGANHNALRLYDENDNELSEMEIFKLFDNAKPPKKMKKETFELLSLKDNASDEAVETAIQKLHDDKVKAENEKAAADDEKAAAEKERDEAKKELKDIQAAELAAKKTAFENELNAAFKDGRLSESTDKPGSVKQGWLDLYDKSPEGADTALKNLKPHQSASKMDLGDPKGESAWEKRQKEIEANAKK